MNVILENIKKIADNEGVTVAKLERIIGASKGVLYRAMANNSDIQTKWVIKIVEKYPKYSCEWLLKSEGLMLKDDYSDNYQPEIIPSENDLTYKKLAETQKDTIESLKKVVFHLEKEISFYENRDNNMKI
ncbi:hypothetical protein [Flavobacterium sp. KACC 22763]|uniref:hypothetical protein n=1 Tax=Flavobacterium sp. KACC 22763 TaxID=3025668 RepID=UPI002365A046|nr:hypothetical protein [Flavobacterium sp. KACC 22763]WDF62537.1 hypothetical protein PQ463_12965 [Flavobacterium sp. KACC 22763]